MKFGIFYELSVPRPWTPEAEHKVYKNALEQVRLADELGFYNVWAVEQGDRASRVNPATNDTMTYDGLSGAYSYSDMTGFGLRHAGIAPPPPD